MEHYLTGSAIRTLREAKHLTQDALGQAVHVSGKAISKWETGRGMPDITLIEPLARALDVSVMELLSGQPVQNRNRSANLRRSCFYVCPVCGNVIHALGEAAISCCGVRLPALSAEDADESHRCTVTPVEDAFYVSLDHPMTREHFISWLAYVSGDRLQLIKLYPEGGAAARIQMRGMGTLYGCCNRDGLFVLHRR